MADRPNNRGRKSRKKVCGFCVDKVEHIDYKDIAHLPSPCFTSLFS